ncbi:MAG: YidC/Oxa1 family insertase periplasmic-domain containing protein [Planctomycetota bacterium]
MGRQTLTFVVVLVGIFLLMQTCAPKPQQRRGLAVEPADPVPEDAIVLRHPGSGAEVRLASDGSVASITEGQAAVVKPVRAGRRPFHLHLGNTASPKRLPDAGWTREEVPGGGWKCVHAQDRLRVAKTVRFTEDGHGLVLELEAEGAPEGLILTGASGVDMSGDGSGTPFAFWQIAGAEPQMVPFPELRQKREADPARLFADFAEPAGRVGRFGLLGRDFCLSLDGLPPIFKLFVDVYRASRDGGETDDAECWVDVAAPGGNLRETFTLRWAPRAEAVKTFPGDDLRAGREFVLDDATFRVVFSDRGAAIVAMWLKRYSTVAGEPPSEKTWIPILGGGVADMERALTLSADGHGRSPARDIWEAEPAPDGRSIRFTLQMPDGWRLWKRIALPGGDRFDLEVEIGIEAPAGTAGGQSVVSLVGPSGSYIVDSYRGIIGADMPATFVLDRNGDDQMETIEDLGKEILDRNYAGERTGRFKAIGTRGAYFVCALVSEDPRNAVTNAVGKRIELDKPQERADGKPPTRDSMLGKVVLSLPLEGGRAAQTFRLYAGPNETSALKALDIGGSVHFGWFGPIGRALMWLMKALQGLVGSYGIAIMLMTVIVRALLLPISFKTQLSMQRYGKRIQKIKPLLDEISKKYPKDPQRMNQERMKIMREHGVGLPLGCLTIFLQIPIWYALFQALRVEFALRHQPFLWVHDLAMPDRLFALPMWPHWFNLLPLLMLALWVLQQKLAPTPGSDDPQVKMQMKMMKFMPYVFFLFLYDYAAGLALYMCVSSCWTIAESRLVKRAIARLG